MKLSFFYSFIFLFLLISCNEQSYQPQKSNLTNSNQNTAIEKKPDLKKITPDLIKEIQSWNFFERHGFYLDSKWELSSRYYGPGF